MAQTMDMYEQLYNRMSQEYANFLEDLGQMPVSEVINHAYEKVFKEDFLLSVDNENLSLGSVKSLLTLQCPLDRLYQDWLNRDYSYMDLLRDSIAESAKTVRSSLMVGQEIPPKRRGKSADQTIRLNAMAEDFDEVTILEKPALFTLLRIDRSTVPNGYHVYEIRHDDEGDPAQLAKSVLVNHFGSLITRSEIKLSADGCLDIEYDALNFGEGTYSSMTDFMDRFPAKANKHLER